MITKECFDYEPDLLTYFCKHSSERKTQGFIQLKSIYHNSPKMLLCLDDNCSPIKILPYKDMEGESERITKDIKKKTDEKNSRGK